MSCSSNANTLLLVAALALAWGCIEDKKGSEVEEPALDSSTPDAGTRGADANQDASPDCTLVPDHLQIINAVTDAEKVDKQPVLPLLKDDGSLPDFP